MTAQLTEPSPTTGRPLATPAEELAAVLADVLQADSVPLDGHFFDDLGADSMVMARFCARLRKRDDLPSVSMKDVYQHPTVRSLAAAFPGDPAVRPPVEALAAVLADVLHLDSVPVDSHFFDDLGADSMVMAQFCARLRKRDDLPPLSIKDVYQHPTVRALASLSQAAASPSHGIVRTPDEPVPAPVEPQQASWSQHTFCGALQLLIFLGYTYLGALVMINGYEWISAGSGLVDDYLRAAVFGGATFLGASTLPIVAKWVLVGRWKPQEIRVWSLAYVRFWTVKTLVRANPLVLFFGGSPLFVLYLRALGADIGRGVVIFARTVPVATDLLTIGPGTIIRKDALIPGYRAHHGMIETGPVTLGRDVVVSEATVLEIRTAMGDGAQLGHRSSLHAGQTVPAGERWHGSPAQPTPTDFRLVDPAACGTTRRVVYSVLQLLTVLFLTVPLVIGAVSMLLVVFPRLRGILEVGPVALTDVWFYEHALVISAVLFFGPMLIGLLYVVTVPRLLGLVIEPDRTYPLYGFHYSVHRAIARTTNVKFFTGLLGDSSYIVHYLQALGYDLNRVVQTGTNFGMSVKHENPYLVSIGSGTMVADGLSLINADFSSSSFRVTRTSIGPRNFLGNAVAYPAQSRTGDNCLLATKVMVPIDGEVREGVGLLGSPSFEIPRTVDRDTTFDHMSSGEDLARHVSAKNRYDLRTIALFLLLRWTGSFLGTLILLVGLELRPLAGMISMAVATVASVLFAIAYAVFIERAVARFRPLTPQFCSIYDPYFWWHERLWKLMAGAKALDGTPYKSLVWRLRGVAMGKRVFDDGSDIPEASLVSVGDHCTLNAGTVIQCHSQEDGAFKLDRITIGSGVTIGVATWVHYGTTIGDGAVLAADSYLMKGEEVPPYAYWGGNPAQELRAGVAARPALAARPEATVPGAPSGRHRAPRELDVARRLPEARNATTTTELQHR